MTAITAPTKIPNILAVRMCNFREIPPVIIAQADHRPADTSVLRAHAPQGSGIRMRSWPIRRLLVASTVLAAVLLTVTPLGVLGSSRHPFWLIASLNAAI